MIGEISDLFPGTLRVGMPKGSSCIAAGDTPASLCDSRPPAQSVTISAQAQTFLRSVFTCVGVP